MQYRTTSYEEGVFDTYWFEKNLQGDIIAVYNDAGTLLVKYTYDAWGNTVSTTYSNGGSGTIVRNNRFRYRGYYYDIETGFYYLNSRYYDPSTGRFVNADGYVSTGQGLIGNNMYAYCNNNPIMFFDPQGTALMGLTRNNQLQMSLYGSVRAPLFGSDIIREDSWLDKLISDFKNYNINNTDEQKVIDCNYFSSYRGKLVIRTGLDRSGSLGVLFIRYPDEGESILPDEIRHEFGHTQQLKELGLKRYLTFIALPSVFEWGTADYYDKPWEVLADVYGGVTSRSPSSVTVEKGLEHMERAQHWDLLYLYGQSIW